jgi:hypothetical protein
MRSKPRRWPPIADGRPRQAFAAATPCYAIADGTPAPCNADGRPRDAIAAATAPMSHVSLMVHRPPAVRLPSTDVAAAGQLWRAARRIASMLRSTSASVVLQFDTEMRMAALPCQVVPPSQLVPSA